MNINKNGKSDKFRRDQTGVGRMPSIVDGVIYCRGSPSGLKGLFAPTSERLSSAVNSLWLALEQS